LPGVFEEGSAIEAHPPAETTIVETAESLRDLGLLEKR